MNYELDRTTHIFGGQSDAEWTAWFTTPGDADDFIFYWEDEVHSDK